MADVEESIVKVAIPAWRRTKSARDSIEYVMKELLQIEALACDELVKKGVFPDRNECMLRLSEKVGG